MERSERTVSRDTAWRARQRKKKKPRSKESVERSEQCAKTDRDAASGSKAICEYSSRLMASRDGLYWTSFCNSLHRFVSHCLSFSRSFLSRFVTHSFALSRSFIHFYLSPLCIRLSFLISCHSFTYTLRNSRSKVNLANRHPSLFLFLCAYTRHCWQIQSKLYLSCFTALLGDPSYYHFLSLSLSSCLTAFLFYLTPPLGMEKIFQGSLEQTQEHSIIEIQEIAMN